MTKGDANTSDLFQFDKQHLQKYPTVNIIFNGDTLEACPLRLRIKQERLLLPQLFNIVLDALDTAIN